MYEITVRVAIMSEETATYSFNHGHVFKYKNHQPGIVPKILDVTVQALRYLEDQVSNVKGCKINVECGDQHAAEAMEACIRECVRGYDHETEVAFRAAAKNFPNLKIIHP